MNHSKYPNLFRWNRKQAKLNFKSFRETKRNQNFLPITGEEKVNRKNSLLKVSFFQSWRINSYHCLFILPVLLNYTILKNMEFRETNSLFCKIKEFVSLLFCGTFENRILLVTLAVRASTGRVCIQFSQCARLHYRVDVWAYQRNNWRLAWYTIPECISDICQIPCKLHKVECVDSRGGHMQLFFRSAIAIPQLEGSISATWRKHFRNFLKNVGPQLHFAIVYL